jgi:hypothetical protein
MHTIRGQILAGTRVDAHGERNQVDWLHRFADMYAGKRMPMNQAHDLSLGSPGYIENLRVLPDESSAGDWCLVGDVHFERDGLAIPVGGFSISFLEVLRPSASQDLLHVYLPYPHYNDEAILDEVFEEGFVSVGRWAKKEADPNTIALVGAVIIAIFTPAWNNLYQSTIAPHIERFFRERFSRLQARGIHADFIQYISYEGREVQAILIPLRGQEQQCFAIERTAAAMFKIHEYLVGLERNHVPIAKVYMKFHVTEGGFRFLRFEYADGTTRDA